MTNEKIFLVKGLEVRILSAKDIYENVKLSKQKSTGTYIMTSTHKFVDFGQPFSKISVELTKKKLMELLLEPLSDLEHKQWQHWRKYVEDKFGIEPSPYTNVRYALLSETVKEADRVWARKVIDELFKRLEELK